MKKIRLCFLLLIYFISLAQVASGQIYLLRSKKAVVKQFNQYAKTVSFKSIVAITDTTVTLLVKDSVVRELNFTCYFNSKNRCYKQTQSSDCDSCFRKYLQQVFDMKRFAWKQINKNCYLSKPFWSTTILIDSTKQYSFSLVHDHFSRVLHKQYYNAAN
jgi:hypothetical protein